MDKKTKLDPFRAIIGMFETRNSSDKLRAAANMAGLVYDSSLSKEENYSHSTRTRALVPRILSAYDKLSEPEQISVARAVLFSLNEEEKKEATVILEKLGWSLQDEELIVKTPDVREVFFPKDSPWDAHNVLRDLFTEAKRSLTIVDAFADTTILRMLAVRSLSGLTVHILCSKYADALSAEAKTFAAQYSGMSIEIRKSRDFHDRFAIIDEKKCVHIGSSIKDAGKAACMISYVEDDNNRFALLDAITKAWQEATVI